MDVGGPWELNPTHPPGGRADYSDRGWVVHVLPWVVGISGLIDPLHLESALKFLDVQRKLWKLVVERTVLASVKAFQFLHKV